MRLRTKINTLLKSFNKRLQENAELVSVGVNTGLYAVLLNNKSYVIDVRRAIVGLREYLKERKLSENSEVFTELEHFLIDEAKLPYFMEMNIVALIEMMFDTVDDTIWGKMTPEQTFEFWDKILVGMLRVCDSIPTK